MNLDLILAVTHHILVFGLFGILFAEFFVVRADMTRAAIQRIATVDLFLRPSRRFDYHRRLFTRVSRPGRPAIIANDFRNTQTAGGWNDAHLITPPLSAIVERQADGSLLMAATDETFSVANPAHLAAARDILAAAGGRNSARQPLRHLNGQK